ncbi:hypothetical protein CHARACLAT_000308 [Characodon lateralis]|uniref:Uncharacterized protein n=1 Tax=Characodon lateralis TaxID=208331 RepID=A0ABU7DGI0_9TELE|nr:hypothetical protein [Characodon lateralis]
MPISRARPATAMNKVDTITYKKTTKKNLIKIISAYMPVQTSSPLHFKACTHTEQGQQSSVGYMKHVRAAMFRKATFRMHFANKERKHLTQPRTVLMGCFVCVCVGVGVSNPWLHLFFLK